MKLSIDNLMFDELKHGFDDHLISLVKILTRGPVRTGEINLKLAVDINVSSDFNGNDIITPAFKWTVTSKTSVQKFEHKGSPQGDYQLEIDINGINVKREEEEQMELFKEGAEHEIDIEYSIQNDAPNSQEQQEPKALPLNESKEPEPWDKEEVYTCQECGFQTAEAMSKCPKCEGEMLPATLPMESVTNEDATGEHQTEDNTPLDQAS